MQSEYLKDKKKKKRTIWVQMEYLFIFIWSKNIKTKCIKTIVADKNSSWWNLGIASSIYLFFFFFKFSTLDIYIYIFTLSLQVFSFHEVSSRYTREWEGDLWKCILKTNCNGKLLIGFLHLHGLIGLKSQKGTNLKKTAIAAFLFILVAILKPDVRIKYL